MSEALGLIAVGYAVGGLVVSLGLGVAISVWEDRRAGR